MPQSLRLYGALIVVGITTAVLAPMHVRHDAGIAWAHTQEIRTFEYRERPHDPPAPPALPVPGAPKALEVMFGPFTSIQVNVDGAGANIPGDAANEPNMAVDPTRPNTMAIGWRQFDNVTSDFRQAGYGYSGDGGRNWTFPGVLDAGNFRSDPVLDFDSAGNFYYNSLFVASPPFGGVETDVFKSTNGGQSWDPPVFAWGGDKQWMTIDRTGGTGDGHIYCTWQLGLACCNDSTFTRSTDGGASFEQPVPPQMPKFGTLAVAPNGDVYVGGVNFAGTQFQIAKSTNADNPAVTPTLTVTGPIDMGGVQTINGGVTTPNPAGLLGQVYIDVDPLSGHVYMLCSVDPPGPDPLDVHFIRSEDGGANWSTPVRVNDDPAGTDAWQWFGTMSVSPNGRIDVVWNDTRNTGNPMESELFYSWSIDGGLTWAANQQVSPSFNSHVGFPNQEKMGDYYDLVSDQVGAHLAWAATFNGEQDVYYTRLGEYDCNNNGIGDETEIAGDPTLDGNMNGILDECETPPDTQPPTITVELNRDVLWPPNHKLVEISATVTVMDDTDPAPTFVLESIESDEPDNGEGDGNTTNDIQDADVGTPDEHFKLRSERQAKGDGRKYTIIYTATDAAGNTASDTVCVTVPVNQSGMAMASSGFSPDGTAFDRFQEHIALVIPSIPGKSVGEGGRQLGDAAPFFDATALDASRVYVGNTEGALRPDGNLVMDVNGDGFEDLAVLYVTRDVLPMMGRQSPGILNDGRISLDTSAGPLGLHYKGPDGHDYLVPDILALGEPVPLLPSLSPMPPGGPVIDAAVPAETGLTSIYPNPFNPSTTVGFYLERAVHVTIHIFDTRGALVRTLRSEAMPAGDHSVVWNGRDDSQAPVATGVYFVRLVAGDHVSARKVLMMK